MSLTLYRNGIWHCNLLFFPDLNEHIVFLLIRVRISPFHLSSYRSGILEALIALETNGLFLLSTPNKQLLERFYLTPYHQQAALHNLLNAMSSAIRILLL